MYRANNNEKESLKDFRSEVEINLPKGIYIFYDDSFGKTFLCNQLKELNYLGEPVDGFTYEEFVKGRKLHSVLSTRNKIAMLDRFDMYNTKENRDLIDEMSKYMTILIDMKQPYYGQVQEDFCSLEKTGISVKVY